MSTPKNQFVQIKTADGWLYVSRIKNDGRVELSPYKKDALDWSGRLDVGLKLANKSANGREVRSTS